MLWEPMTGNQLPSRFLCRGRKCDPVLPAGRERDISVLNGPGKAHNE